MLASDIQAYRVPDSHLTITNTSRLGDDYTAKKIRIYP